jgi:Major Facilitator Superfamily
MGFDDTALKMSSRLSIAVSTIGFNQTAFIALVPLIATATGLQTGEIGLTAGLGAVAFVASAPLCGMLGARIGARRALYWLGLVLLLAQLIFLALMVVGPLPYVPALGLLVVSRLVYGAASAGIMPIAQAWISGLLPQKERTVALARLSAGLSIGRILGSAAAVTASVMPLLPLMLLVASPLSLLLAPAANDTVGKAGPRSDSRAYLSPLDGRLLPFLGLGFLVTMSFGHVQMILGPLLQLHLAVGPAEATAAAGDHADCCGACDDRNADTGHSPVAARQWNLRYPRYSSAGCWCPARGGTPRICESLRTGDGRSRNGDCHAQLSWMAHRTDGTGRTGGCGWLACKCSRTWPRSGRDLRRLSFYSLCAGTAFCQRDPCWHGSASRLLDEGPRYMKNKRDAGS